MNQKAITSLIEAMQREVESKAAKLRHGFKAGLRSWRIVNGVLVAPCSNPDCLAEVGLKVLSTKEIVEIGDALVHGCPIKAAQ